MSNFLSLPEDPVVRCGYYRLSFYNNPKDDPYYPFCEWDDNATTDGSFESKIVDLDRHIENGLAQLNLLQVQFQPGTWEYRLGNIYKTVWPELVGYFASNKVKPVVGDPIEKPEPWE